MIDWIRAQLLGFGLDQTNVRKTELSSEEALVNVIEHGYKGLPGQINIALIDSEMEIRIIFEDRGPAFNPLKQQVGFDPSATLEVVLAMAIPVTATFLPVPAFLSL